MPNKYRVQGSSLVNASGNATALALSRSTFNDNLCKIKEFFIGNIDTDGLKLDKKILHTVQRFESKGAGTFIIAKALDKDDYNSARTIIEEDHSTPPTYLAGEFIFRQALRITSVLTWKAAHRYEIILENSAGFGVGWKAFHSSITDRWHVTVTFAE